MDIRVNTTDYKRTHGDAPRGYGDWVFMIGNKTTVLNGNFSFAKKTAIRIAREVGAKMVRVLA